MTTQVVINGQEYQKASPRHKDWETPPEFFRALDEEFHFTLDAAADHENALCDTYCTVDGTFWKGAQYAAHDGLEHDWSGFRVFCNPPYDRSLADWCAKASKLEAEVAVLLLPPSVDTAWFHDYIWNKPNVEVRIRRGRLKFWHDGKPGEAPRAGNLLAIFR